MTDTGSAIASDTRKSEAQLAHEARRIFDGAAFDLCGRSNLEYALQVIEDAAAYEPPGKLPRIQLDNAAATIRELLDPNGSYFATVSR